MSGGAALIFLFRRQLVRFLEFAIRAVMVATLIFTPELVNVAKAVAQVIGGEA